MFLYFYFFLFSDSLSGSSVQEAGLQPLSAMHAGDQCTMSGTVAVDVNEVDFDASSLLQSAAQCASDGLFYFCDFCDGCSL